MSSSILLRTKFGIGVFKDVRSEKTHNIRYVLKPLTPEGERFLPILERGRISLMLLTPGLYVLSNLIKRMCEKAKKTTESGFRFESGVKILEFYGPTSPLEWNTTEEAADAFDKEPLWEPVQQSHTSSVRVVRLNSHLGLKRSAPISRGRYFLKPLAPRLDIHKPLEAHPRPPVLLKRSTFLRLLQGLERFPAGNYLEGYLERALKGKYHCDVKTAHLFLWEAEGRALIGYERFVDGSGKALITLI